MMWLWLTLVWLLGALVVGVWLGRSLRAAEVNDAVRVAVDQALDAELARL